MDRIALILVLVLVPVGCDELVPSVIEACHKACSGQMESVKGTECRCKSNQGATK